MADYGMAKTASDRPGTEYILGHSGRETRRLILRGIAILLIFVLDISWMENTLYHFHADPRLLGWSPADQLY